MFAFICKSEKCLSHGIFCLSHFLFVRELMMGLFLFAHLFTHLVECTVTISIRNINMFSKNYVFSCFPKTLKYDLGNYAMRLTMYKLNEKLNLNPGDSVFSCLDNGVTGVRCLF